MAFQYGKWEEGEESKRARQAWQDLQAPDPYQSQYDGKVQSLLGQIENRKPFQYDVNGDALYQMYKNQYVTAGKQAMQDTMGQAAAMTGGYGNSYAASAGNQAYQAYLGKLNEMVPQLYNIAYNQYQQQGQDLKDLYSMYNARENQDYGRWRDAMGDYRDDRSYLYGIAQDARNWDYGLWSDEEERRYKNYQLALAELQGSGGSGGSGSRKSPSGYKPTASVPDATPEKDTSRKKAQQAFAEKQTLLSDKLAAQGWMVESVYPGKQGGVIARDPKTGAQYHVTQDANGNPHATYLGQDTERLRT
jgi:hypothetical protein